MQRVVLDIQDGFMQDFLHIITPYQDKIHIQQDTQLEQDAYFHQRRQKLDRVREGIQNGSLKLLSEEEAANDMESFLVDLETHANHQN